MQAVSSETVVQYLPRVERQARIFHGLVAGCEYDDLVQEGSLHVFLKLRNGQEPSNTGIKNAMRDWVRKCARRGLTDELPEDLAA